MTRLSWSRVGSLQLASDTRRLTLGASTGAFLDALLELPDNPDVDRSAMNVLQNWNDGLWYDPLER